MSCGIHRLVEDALDDDPLVQRILGANCPDHEIIGVVKDFHYQSLRDEVVPLALVLEFDVLRPGISDILISSSPAPDLLVRLRAGDVPAALAALEQTWGQVLPGEAFEYRFLDDELDAQYAQERR